MQSIPKTLGSAHLKVITNDDFMGNTLDTKIIKESVKALALNRKNRVLELGHGMCKHLPFLMQQAKELKYFGMEISEEIVQKAYQFNKSYVNENNALFQTFDGHTIPYVHNIFDRIICVNTLYNYKEPIAYLNELFRCLKPGGVCVVSLSNNVFLEKLKASEDKKIFPFYDEEKLNTIVDLSDFSIFSIHKNKERIKTTNGTWEDEDYFIVTLRKKPRSRYIR